MKNILTIILVAMFCLGSVETMAQRTITRQSTPQPVRPTKEQQYQKDLKAGEKLFDQEKYADAKKHFVKMLPKYPKHKQEINDWIASCEMMLGDSAGDAEVQSQTSGLADMNFSVNGVSFKMVAVKGGTFTMGATSEQGSDAYPDEKTTHRVTLSDYYIGETEVTQALWEAVMGSNPSSDKGSNLPVESVSWEDCQEFISRLNSLTGKTFSLPTEAEWEYAARGGNKSKGYKYSGSNNIDQVAWYTNTTNDSGTKPVATKTSNELGLYDMSGNVWEWCLDWKGSYSSGSQTNPTGPSSGEYRVLRGGSWVDLESTCRVSYRSSSSPGSRYLFYGLRVCLSSVGSMYSYRQSSSSATSGLADKTITVNGVSFKMVAVNGGTFTMGATSEQGSDADSDEKPTHSVTLSDYYIGEAEVTQALWEAVMGSNPSCVKGSNLPVNEVSWDDCQDFIKKLNSLTGLSFRLPTEAEWEYAARGGNKSKGYKYSGSNNIDQVAWYIGNSGDKTHAVKQKQANELGLYDMSGNVEEWCLDWKGSYSSGSQTNPTGPSSGEYRVLRGGYSLSGARDCRVSNRSNYSPGNRSGLVGLRVCLPSVGSMYGYRQSSSSATSGYINGHEWVDLGLPSGLKWATCNVGASSPSDYGNYYSWGEISTKSRYGTDNCETYEKTILDFSGNSRYDAARANWGSSWRMPTKAEFEELEQNCTWEWTKQSGKVGHKVTSKKNGKSIFLPAAQDMLWEEIQAIEGATEGCYWSSTPDSEDNSYAYYLHFIHGRWNYEMVNHELRYHGMTIRPVSD